MQVASIRTWSELVDTLIALLGVVRTTTYKLSSISKTSVQEKNPMLMLNDAFNLTDFIKSVKEERATSPDSKHCILPDAKRSRRHFPRICPFYIVHITSGGRKTSVRCWTFIPVHLRSLLPYYPCAIQCDFIGNFETWNPSESQFFIRENWIKTTSADSSSNEENKINKTTLFERTLGRTQQYIWLRSISGCCCCCCCDIQKYRGNFSAFLLEIYGVF